MRSSPKKSSRKSAHLKSILAKKRIKGKATPNKSISFSNGNDSSVSYDFLTAPASSDSSSAEERCSPNKNKRNVSRASESRRSPRKSDSSHSYQSPRESVSRIVTKTPPKVQNRRKQQLPRKHKHRISKQIINLQRTVNDLIPKLPFQRLVREIIIENENAYDQWRITPTALEALQSSAEIFIVQIMEDSYLCTLHRGRVTLQPKDMKLAKYLRNFD